MKRICGFILTCVLTIPIASWAFDTKIGEKQMFTEMRKLIPADKIRTTDDLFHKWLEIQDGKSSAVIIDLRTEAEFNNGHIRDSNNIDSGHAYTIPDKWPDPQTEMWVLCRTTHRATYFVGSLYKYGYTNVYLVDTGISGWAEKSLPLVNTYLGEIKVTKYHKKLNETYAFRENR